ncbi:TrkA C-terminal domain-containing protein [Pelagibius sp.]|uniref:TrkA C-terminal domain-containing protein n=1 Tax=Pelagibius sp. TaxID=1931238 RepID=UPI0026091ED9|nr:TrkA C-terminal domain-containing protein [Pelagibius sp.]
MIAALTLFVVLTLSVLVIRTGAVALRLTGLPEATARFQARSAFTGTGFTTSESEALVNHPVRRRIISLLMVVGSLGFVSVMATVIVSLVGSSGSQGSMVQQLLWLAAVLVVLWFVALNPVADRIMCRFISALLTKTEGFGGRRPLTLLQLPADHCVLQVLAHPDSGLVGRNLQDIPFGDRLILGLEKPDGRFLNRPAAEQALEAGDQVFLYGATEGLDTALEAAARAKAPSA